MSQPYLPFPRGIIVSSTPIKISAVTLLREKAASVTGSNARSQNSAEIKRKGAYFTAECQADIRRSAGTVPQSFVPKGVGLYKDNASLSI